MTGSIFASGINYIYMVINLKVGFVEEWKINRPNTWHMQVADLV